MRSGVVWLLLVLAATACATAQPVDRSPLPALPTPSALEAPAAVPSGAIPNWREDPNEPYPFRTPVPPLVATVVDGIYTRPPTIERDPSRPHCRRCPPYPHDAGTSILTLRGGRFEMLHEEPRYRMEGHFVVEGDELVFFNDAECTGVRGRYRWSLDGETLTLQVVEDECAFGQRRKDLTARQWTRVGDAPLSGVRAECLPPDLEAAISGHWAAPSGC